MSSFEKGYAFNALVIDSVEDKGTTHTPAGRPEHFRHASNDRNIAARYLSGKAI